MPLLKKTNRLREIRANKGLSGYDLQILSSIPACSIYLIERGLKRARPYERALLAEALGLPEGKLFPTHLENLPKIEGSGC